MSDPFTILREELVSAAERSQPETSPARWGWLRLRTHPLAVVLGALVISGTAAAAVLSLTASSSAPLSGRVPGTIEAASLAGYRYTITVTPDLAAGSAGWGTAITYSKDGRVGDGSGGGGLYPTASNPLFGGDEAIDSLTLEPGRRGDTVGYVLTSPEVAAVRIGNRTIRTFTSAELPAGDRAAVFFLPAHSPQLMFNWRPGEPVRSHIRLPQFPGYRGPTVIPTLAVLPLDREGNVIATRFTPPDGSFPSFWQAPSAVTRNNHQAPYHGPSHPLPGVCELAQHGLRGLTPEWGHVIRNISPASDSEGTLFLACIDTHYYFRGWPLVAAILLDGRHPGRVLGSIPGAQAVPAYPDTVNVAAAGLTARRIGKAWLVVEGGSGMTQRLEVLRALSIRKLDLRHVGSGRAPF